MAQSGENRLFGQVLRRCNAGSGRGPPVSSAEKPAKCDVDCRQFEVRGFTQSLIVGIYSSRVAGTGKDMCVKLTCVLIKFAADESGATAIEYGLIAAGISLAIIAAVNNLGTRLSSKFSAISSSLR